MDALKRLNDRLNDLFMLLAGIALILMMGISCVNMLLRFVGTPMSAAYELVGFLGAIVVSFPLGYTQLKKSHIAVDVISKTFPARVRKVVVGLSLVLGMVFFFIAAWKVGAHANTLRVAGELSETLRIRFYPFTFGVAAACGALTLCLFIDFLLLWAPSEEASK